MILRLVVEYGFLISLIANALLFIPQALVILKTQNVKDVSLLTFAGFNVIQLFTVFHGIIVHDFMLTAGYLLSLITCGFVSALIVYYKYIKKSTAS
ncbi:MAG: hypothetical protein A3F17_01895 [Gammaproteobacteria bacterium RIFCSPHIGHO2_12_FULL_41_15]|nr:MAG: hypothetical protein A3F17_01895 [Gammaproteobacteria bacterium RIFCSPHIGHO2_12_FULL_41_15]